MTSENRKYSRSREGNIFKFSDPSGEKDEWKRKKEEDREENQNPFLHPYIRTQRKIKRGGMDILK